MSILISTLLPIFVSGVPAAQSFADAFSQALAESRAAFAGRPETSSPVALPVKAAPVIVSPAKPLSPSIAPVSRAPAAQTPAAGPVGGQLILAQAPVAGPVPSPAPAPIATADRAAIIDKAGKALETVKTAEGRFSQTDAGGGQSSGKFYISRPGKVRFEYTSPEPMFIVSDGVSVSIEEPKRKSYDAVPLSSTPLNLFLRSNVDLKKDGSVTEVSSSSGSHFVTLEDRSGEAEGSMILEFRAADFELLGWRALDGTGAETRVRLADTKTNVAVKPALFVVRDPADDDRR